MERSVSNDGRDRQRRKSAHAMTNLMESSYTSSTRQHATAALKKSANFLAHCNNGLHSLNSLGSSDVNEDLFGKFAAFLVADVDIGFSTSSTYLSSVKRQLVQSTSTHFFSDNQEWYKALRRTLRRTYLEQTSAQGKLLQDKAPLMTVGDLVVLTTRLWERNDVRSLKDRTLVSLQWALVGRSSDVGDVLFSELQWTGNFILIRVTRKKTRQQHSVSVFSSALQWTFDPIHALAAQLAADTYGLSDRLFSQIAFETAQQDNISVYINRLFDSLSDKGDNKRLTPKLRSHSSRRGAAVVAAASADVKLSDLAHRGRWTMDGFNTVLEYIAETSSSDQKVARVLGGWQHPTRKIEPAKLDLTGDAVLLQQAFARRLFAHYTTRLQTEPLVFALTIVLLLYYADTTAGSPDHVVHSAMLSAVLESSGTTQVIQHRLHCLNGAVVYGSALSETTFIRCHRRLHSHLTKPTPTVQRVDQQSR